MKGKLGDGSFRGWAIIPTVLLTLALLLLPSRLKEREQRRYFEACDRAVRSLELERLRDRYSPVATLLADNAYVSNIRQKSGSSRIYYAALLREQIREFFETRTPLSNILIYLDDVPILIDQNYILPDPAMETTAEFVGYDPFFTDRTSVSLGRNCRLILPPYRAGESPDTAPYIVYLQYKFPRYVADPAKAELQFALDFEMLLRQSPGGDFSAVEALYLLREEEPALFPLYLSSEALQAGTLCCGIEPGSEGTEDSKETERLLRETDAYGARIVSLRGQRYRIRTVPVRPGMRLIALQDPEPPETGLQRLSSAVYAGTALWFLLLAGFHLRPVLRQRRRRPAENGTGGCPDPKARTEDVLRSEIDVGAQGAGAKDGERNASAPAYPGTGAAAVLTAQACDAETPPNDLRSYVDGHFTDPELNAKQLAEIFNYSEKHIYTLWRGQAELSISDYIQELRLGTAYELIIGGDEAISEIARQVGFSSYNTFYKAFRRKYDQTPSRLRRAARPESKP